MLPLGLLTLYSTATAIVSADKLDESTEKDNPGVALIDAFCSVAARLIWMLSTAPDFL